ncbi:MFS transporter [Alteromonas confluentis]|uniref:MFS transporter n=1 Tax=Alteromonas confluentis TaxID=1656094 RepID=A0A1E7ZEW4_9ALTE|nr:MFS transporter [Alteromonas confluentis]OFC72049.1 MFS transporter [Alteromonas confluentis]
MPVQAQHRLQIIIFALVCAAFTNIYITQPVLPVLQQDFDTDLVRVSLTVSAVVLGIALANLPFGLISDRFPIKPIIAIGGTAIIVCGLICAATDSLSLLISARFVQGIFIPALTTCIVAYLSKTLPPASLNVVMGSYVSATVAGGLGGRLLGGWAFSPEHWRYAFVATSLLTAIAIFAALKGLPAHQQNKQQTTKPATSYLRLVAQWKLLRLYLCALCGFGIFSSVFNFLPFHLAEPMFGFSTQDTTLLYLVYLVGVMIGPVTGKLSNRFGSGNTLLVGSAVLLSALLMLLLPFTLAILVGLLLFCAGFFTIHAAAVGALNRKLDAGHGRANALYTLFYYVGGWVGITLSSFIYQHFGWTALITCLITLLIMPVWTGIAERKHR